VLWHGTADGVWAPGNIPYLASRIAGARVQLLPSQGHMLYLENWAAILKQTRELLDTVVTVAEALGKASI
jgi:pimeloyl-ACP methyl ester carboxylesterase